MPTKVHLFKAMVFPVVYGCESWTIKKAERWRIDVFELWGWRGLLRVPWTTKRSNQSILKQINPDYFLKGLVLKLKLQYFGHLMQRGDSLENTLMLWKTEGKKRSGQQRMGWLDGITDSMGMSLSKLHKLVTGPGTRLSNCTEMNIPLCVSVYTQKRTHRHHIFICPSVSRHLGCFGHRYCK